MNPADLQDDSEDSSFTPEQRKRAADKSTWVSVAVNTVMSITQILVGISAKSQGLIADGIHSLSDLIGDFVVLFASHHMVRRMQIKTTPMGTSALKPPPQWFLGALLIAVAARHALGLPSKN
jgi:Co/Zn/Cd efflux system component